MKEYSYGICPYKIENSKVQILLIQPKGHKEWGFIKGKIDVGETKEECAIRECLEETNISVNEIHLENFFEQPNSKKDVGIFLVDCCNLNLSNIKLEKREIENIKFFNIKEHIKINKNQEHILFNIQNLFWKKEFHFK